MYKEIQLNQIHTSLVKSQRWSNSEVILEEVLSLSKSQPIRLSECLAQNLKGGGENPDVNAQVSQNSKVASHHESEAGS